MSEIPPTLESALADRYRIERVLGRGGMATVYLSTDLKLNRSVALKVLSVEATEIAGVGRFEREVNLLAGLVHPNIVPLFDSGSAGPHAYYTMPYVAAGTLRDRLRREGKLPLDEAIEIASKIADALDYANAQSICHRDVKPENVLLDGHQVLVADFGIASVLDPVTHLRLTVPGVSVGTPAYASPEQAEGKPVDARSDVYALGCVAYEMIAGAPPFTGTSAGAVLNQHLTTAPRPLAKVRPGTPAHVSAATQKALAKAPEDRFASPGDFAAALRSPSSRGHRVRGLAWAGAVALAAALAYGLWSAPARQSSLRGTSGSSDAPSRAWVLVSEFESPERSLGIAARQLVVAQIDRSSTFQAVPTEQMRVALNLAALPDTTRVDAVLARQLAYRKGIHTVVEGRIDRLGSALSILLRATNAADGSVLATATGEASEESDLIRALRRTTDELRKSLGDPARIEGTGKLVWEGTTPSFEAYRKYAEGFELQQMQGDDRGSLLLLREALRIDPEFAEAWAIKGFGHGHLGEEDSAAVCIREALRHPDRLTEEGRLFYGALVSAWEGDIAQAEANYRELIRRGYQLSSTYGNRGGMLMGLGRFDEALEMGKRALEASPFGPQQWVLGGYISLNLMFGKVDEAERASKQLKGWLREFMPLPIAVTRGNWTRAESLATGFVEDPSRSGEVRIPALRTLAVTAGSVSERRAALERAIDEAAKDGRQYQVHTLAIEDAMLASVAGVSPRPVAASIARDTSTAGILAAGLLAAASGDRKVAAKALLTASGRANSRENIDDLAILRGWVAGTDGDWARASEEFRPVRLRGEASASIVSPIFVHWLAAHAFAETGHADSALAALDRIEKPDGYSWTRRLDAKLLAPYLRQRRVDLEAVAKARSSKART